MEPKTVSKEKTDGKKRNTVLNFQIECFDGDGSRPYKLPVAIWGTKEVFECQEHLKLGDLVLVSGELRYKFVRNKETKQLERIYTTVKASNIEFLSKKLKHETLNYSINEVRLVGNLVHDPTVSPKGFVVAVDRLYPTKEATAPNEELTDYVTLVLDSKEKMRGNLKKGSVVIIEGKLMTRKREKDIVMPTVVVDVREIIGR